MIATACTADRRTKLDLTKLQRLVVDALEDVKAQDIKVYNTLGLSDMFDRVVLASGTSNRQTRSLAWSVVEKVKQAGGKVISVEGTDPGEWVLVDLGDLVVHIMQPAVRQYYGLEEMWGAKPVRVKLAEDRRGNRPDGAAPKPAKKAARRPAGKAAPAKRAKKVAAGKAAKPPRKAAARPRVGKASAGRTAVRKSPARASSRKVATKAPTKTARKNRSGRS